MRTSREELTLTSALADPLIRTVMAADKIDPLKLKSMLTTIAAQVAPARLLTANADCDCGTA